MCRGQCTGHYLLPLHPVTPSSLHFHLSATGSAAPGTHTDSRAPSLYCPLLTLPPSSFSSLEKFGVSLVVLLVSGRGGGFVWGAAPPPPGIWEGGGSAGKVDESVLCAAMYCDVHLLAGP